MVPTRPTYFLTCVAYRRRQAFLAPAAAKVAYETILRSAEMGRFRLHAFVIMPDHVHVLFEPGEKFSLERCVQFIKGGISFNLRETVKGEIWQREYHDHRVRDDDEFLAYRGYIERNPSKRGLKDWRWIWFASGAKAPEISAG